jgi:Ca2+-binding EF-hand superfamily protein
MHETLFVAHARGPRLIAGALQCSVLLGAVYIAILLVDCIGSAQSWTLYQWIPFVLAWIPPYLNLTWLIPKVVSKLCITTSIEYLKEESVIKEVLTEHKERNLKETLRMLRLLKLRGRTKGDQIGPEVMKRAHEDFAKLPSQTRDEIRAIFNLFDTDASNTIDLNEFSLVLASIGMPPSSPAGEGMLQLYQMIDKDGSGDLSYEEFEVLMALALAPRSEDEEREDMSNMFDIFDEDGSNNVTIDEVVAMLQGLGAPAEEDYLEGTVYDCFRRMKTSLNREEFVEWITFLEKKLDGGRPQES